MKEHLKKAKLELLIYSTKSYSRIQYCKKIHPLENNGLEWNVFGICSSKIITYGEKRWREKKTVKVNLK